MGRPCYQQGEPCHYGNHGTEHGKCISARKRNDKGEKVTLQRNAGTRLQRCCSHLVASAAGPSASSRPFKLVLLTKGGETERRETVTGTSWDPSPLQVKLQEAYPSADFVEVDPKNTVEAKRELRDAQAAFGALNPEYLAAAPNLRWLQCPAGQFGRSPSRYSLYTFHLPAHAPASPSAMCMCMRVSQRPPGQNTFSRSWSSRRLR